MCNGEWQIILNEQQFNLWMTDFIDPVVDPKEDHPVAPIEPVIEQKEDYATQPKQTVEDNSQDYGSLRKQTTMFTNDKRKRTDVCCIIIGVVFLIASIAVPFGLKNNDNTIKLDNPSDSDGKVCGYDHPNYSFIYFTSIPDISQRICVKQCPLTQDQQIVGAPTIISTQPSEAKYYSSKPLISAKGNFCLPSNYTLRKQIINKGKLDQHLAFFRQSSSFMLTLGVALGGSIVFFLCLQLLKHHIVQTTLFLSLISELVLAIILYVFKSDSTGIKIKLILIVILGWAFLLSLFQIILYRQALRVNRVFMRQSTRFLADNIALVLYIPVFIGITGGFLMLLGYLYWWMVSIGTPSFDPQTFHYLANTTTLSVGLPLLGVLAVWGISGIKESFSFCIAVHTINWYYKIPNDCSSVLLVSKLSLLKHLGSVIGAGFLNSFFMPIEAIISISRNCGNPKLKSNSPCLNAIDLTRSDALSYLVLTGNPFCNSAKYSEYLWNETMTSEQSHSTVRIYKIAAHLFISVASSIGGLFLKGAVDPYVITLTIIVGFFICTFFVSFHADASDTIQLLYLLEQQFYKRRAGSLKYITSVLNRSNQLRYIHNITLIYSNKEVAKRLREIRADYWKIEFKPEPEEPEVQPVPVPEQTLKPKDQDAQIQHSEQPNSPGLPPNGEFLKKSNLKNSAAEDPKGSKKGSKLNQSSYGATLKPPAQNASRKNPQLKGSPPSHKK